jgi:hypothetical protein
MRTRLNCGSVGRLHPSQASTTDEYAFLQKITKKVSCRSQQEIDPGIFTGRAKGPERARLPMRFFVNCFLHGL